MTGVIHLARSAYGPAILNGFVESYLRHNNNVAKHELVIYIKGEMPLPTFVKQHAAIIVRIPDKFTDLDVYARAARELEWYTNLVFFNSHTQFTCDFWLDKMLHCLQNNPYVGVVGFSGSYESFATNADTWWKKAILRLFFNEFPNPAIRTNGFLINRKLMLKVWPRRVKTKFQAYLLESGRYGLTQRLGRFNRVPVLCDNMGRCIPMTCWGDTERDMFRRGSQSQLLFRDSQTFKYDGASVIEKLELTKKAWGE